MATGGTLAVVPASALTLSGLHGAGLPAVYGGAALAGSVPRSRTVRHVSNDLP
ncbi:hypothetical protein ABH926_004334 [Catenulispora sp. GP43]|uniref:hypothetical protein n=1 Tax=Catenulispora sp. GP43 TaxID=3156263 RepID=UPI003516DEAB